MEAGKIAHRTGVRWFRKSVNNEVIKNSSWQVADAFVEGWSELFPLVH